ncbi:hypothetical protein H0E84_02285 [Luteimonas sp. SJ-92]|uniref:Entry exclusion lipoprotein TrbK n=1 Tax=Luteimonas salinisoli TaxID=2752307 RepID=A0A853J925_9GAMM|nr:hypothetical protein [Luteimonas salinisoli]NZA25199.1 hypothetical protein [Luteimonas salinisoli]
MKILKSPAALLLAGVVLAGCASGGRDNDATVRLTDRLECQTNQAVEDARSGKRELVDPRCRPEETAIWSSRDDRSGEKIDFRRRSSDD